MGSLKYITEWIPNNVCQNVCPKRVRESYILLSGTIWYLNQSLSIQIKLEISSIQCLSFWYFTPESTSTQIIKLTKSSRSAKFWPRDRTLTVYARPLGSSYNPNKMSLITRQEILKSKCIHIIKSKKQFHVHILTIASTPADSVLHIISMADNKM